MASTITLLCLMGMTGLMFGRPLSSLSCPRHCTKEDKFHPRPQYMQVPDLQNKSIAQWTTTIAHIGGQRDEIAKCAENCTQPGLTPKAIYVKLYYSEKIRDSNPAAYCRCPFKVAVGCTCIKS